MADWTLYDEYEVYYNASSISYQPFIALASSDGSSWFWCDGTFDVNDDVYVTCRMYEWTGSAQSQLDISSYTSSTSGSGDTTQRAVQRALVARTTPSAGGYDWFCMGTENVTGSKPSQGSVNCWKFDHSTKLITSTTILSPPVPKRYGYFGENLGNIKYSAGIGLLVADQDEQLFMYSPDLALVTTYTLPGSGDYVTAISNVANGVTDYFVIQYFDDGSSTHRVALMYFNGTSISMVYSQVSGASVFIDVQIYKVTTSDNDRVHFLGRYSLTSVALYTLSSVSGVTLLDSIVGALTNLRPNAYIMDDGTWDMVDEDWTSSDNYFPLRTIVDFTNNTITKDSWGVTPYSLAAVPCAMTYNINATNPSLDDCIMAFGVYNLPYDGTSAADIYTLPSAGASADGDGHQTSWASGLAAQKQPIIGLGHNTTWASGLAGVSYEVSGLGHNTTWASGLASGPVYAYSDGHQTTYAIGVASGPIFTYGDGHQTSWASGIIFATTEVSADGYQTSYATGLISNIIPIVCSGHQTTYSTGLIYARYEALKDIKVIPFPDKYRAVLNKINYQIFSTPDKYGVVITDKHSVNIFSDKHDVEISEEKRSVKIDVDNYEVLAHLDNYGITQE